MIVYFDLTNICLLIIPIKQGCLYLSKSKFKSLMFCPKNNTSVTYRNRTLSSKVLRLPIHTRNGARLIQLSFCLSTSNFQLPFYIYIFFEICYVYGIWNLFVESCEASISITLTFLFEHVDATCEAIYRFDWKCLKLVNQEAYSN